MASDTRDHARYELPYNDLQTFLQLGRVALGAADVFLLIDQIVGRAANPAEALSPPEVAFSAVATTPEYVASALSEESRRRFIDDVAHFVLASVRGGARGGVASHGTSWSAGSDHVSVAATVDLLLEAGGLAEPLDEERACEGAVELWRVATDADLVLADHICVLADHVFVGIELAYRAVTPEGERATNPLRLRIGTTFQLSLHQMGYHRDSKRGRLAAAFRAAALIGSGRADHPALRAHHHHVRGEALRRTSDGAALYRGYLSNNTANAARIFWWDATPPEVVAVTGHDDSPPV
jgi:hypothetical protein